MDKKNNTLMVSRNWFYQALFVCFAILYAGPVRAAPPLDQLIAWTQERYEKTSDFRARFIQETFHKALNRTEREEGTVHFKKPKRMRWEYLKPKGKLLVINPQQSWLYLPEDKLAYVQETEKMFQSRLAIKFLAGIGRLTDDFQISYHTPSKTDRDGNYLLVLTPKETAEGIDSLLLTLDKTNYAIIQVSFSDFAGNSTRLEFRNMVINTKPAERLFRFKAPKGVEVIQLP